MCHFLVFSLFVASSVPIAVPEPAPAPREKVKFGEWRTGERKKQLLAAGGGDEKTEAAVASGLKWLVRQQKPDGSWSFSGGHHKPVVATGFALLCFLGTGHTPGDGGEFDKQITDGIAVIVKAQDVTTGLIRSTAGALMYEHAICTLALVEAYGMSGDPKLKEPCQKAIDLLVNSQHKEGGWRYEPVPHYPGDVSISGWVIQALTAARYTDLDVPVATLDRANQFLDGCARGEKKATFAYIRYGGHYNPKKAATASAACSKLALGVWTSDDDRLTAAVTEFLKRAPEPKQEGDPYFYYYATRAVYFRGGDDWAKVWNPRMRDYLLDSQNKDGCWPAERGSELRNTGTSGPTFFHLLTLQTYYRYPPPRPAK